MHRGPLWQFYLATFMVVFTAQRGAVACFELRDAPFDVVGIAYLLQAVLAAVVAVGIWIGRRWVLLPVVLLGLASAATAFVRGLAGPEPSISFAIGGSAASLLLAGGLFILLRAEFRQGESNAERAERSARVPRTRPDER